MIRKIYSCILCVCGGLVGVLVFYLTKLLADDSFHRGDRLMTNNTDYSMMILSVFSFALIFYVAAPALSRKSHKTTLSIGKDLQDVPARTILGGVVGIISGLIIALLISMTYRAVLASWVYTLITILLYIVLGYLGYAIGISKSRDVSAPHGKSQSGSTLIDGIMGRKISTPPKVVDTSAIIDGRIADVLRAGFIEDGLVVPEFVVTELQHIADSSDALKRVRGRRGLDVLEEIKQEFSVEIYNTGKLKVLDEIPEVDIKLIKLSKLLGGQLITTDYNLNKVAAINGIKVLNINELANALKPVVIPGEKMIINIIKQGKDVQQGIGYLDDGTMVVVEDGRDHIGKTVTITVTSVIQTAAGKMIFGRQKLQNGK